MMADRPVHPWTRIAARYGTRLLLIGMVPLVTIGLLATTGVLSRLPGAVQLATQLLTVIALPPFVFGVAAAYLPRPGNADPRAIAAPIQGRCVALNGPATKVPSHGMHAFAQTYAIDLLHDPAPGVRPTFGGRRAMRAPREYPSFGQPVHAPADGTVVRAIDGARDHRCRSNLLGYAYMIVEGFVLQLRGTRGLMGNHLVLRLDDGTHVALAHLQRGSIRVHIGDEVTAGQIVAAVGNSGNTSEPHVHLQLMDHEHPMVAVGLPFVFTDVVANDGLEAPAGAPEPLVPQDGTVLHAGVDTIRRERRT
jgi:hypothetical protein